MTYDEWVDKIGKGPSKTIIRDILEDWKTERERLLDDIGELQYDIRDLQDNRE